MSIYRLKSIGMADNNILSVTSGLVSYDANLATKGCTNGVPDVHFDVKSFVLSAPSAAKIARNDTAIGRHTEVTEVNFERIGHLNTMVCIAVIPVMVETCGGRLLLFAFHNAFQNERIYSFHLAIDRCLTGQKVLCLNGNRQD